LFLIFTRWFIPLFAFCSIDFLSRSTSKINPYVEPDSENVKTLWYEHLQGLAKGEQEESLMVIVISVIARLGCTYFLIIRFAKPINSAWNLSLTLSSKLSGIFLPSLLIHSFLLDIASSTMLAESLSMVLAMFSYSLLLP